MSNGPVYAVNLFNVKDKDEYLAYVRRSAAEVPAHGGKVIAIGKYREAEAGDIKPREVFILVEWETYDALRSYIEDPNLADLHPHRIDGTEDYIWHFYDRIEDFRPILKA
ncbi:MAG: DUF1330 domain-containing protein [Bacillota bacterium]|nr:DUF1330 domain-containing protein [Bacillota bacterium]MDW7683586.1 DUF1330 domain-containing protein [Bacillota bacterium]